MDFSLLEDLLVSIHREVRYEVLCLLSHLVHEIFKLLLLVDQQTLKSRPYDVAYGDFDVIFRSSHLEADFYI